MVGRTALVTMALTGAIGFVGGSAVVAGADPGSDAVLCNYTMSDPQVVDVSGTSMVRATLTPAACTGSAEPTSSQVCISIPGMVGRCAELPGYAMVRVYFSPYTPGQTYTVRGRGCASLLQPQTQVCSSLGPKTATL